MIKMKSLCAVALVLISAVLSAQENQFTFSLKEAQQYALQHNKTLMNAKDDILAAGEQIKQSKGAGLPQVNGSMDYMTNFNYEFEFNIGGGDVQPPDIDYSKLDAGDLEVLKSLDQMFGGGGNTIVMEDQANAKVQVSQLIFSGQYWIGVQMAKLQKNIAEKNLTLTELDVKQNVINSYYLILVTQNLLDIISENEQNLQDVLKHTSDMFKVGLAEQTDVDQIKVSLSQISNSKKAMERSLLLNYNLLRLSMGIEPGAEISLTDKLDTIISEIDERLLADVNLEITSNPTYQIMKTQEDISRKNVEMQRWSFAPTLSGYYSYTEKILKTSFDLSPKNAAGLNLSIPIFSGLTKKAQLSQAKIQLDKMNRQKELLEEQLLLQEKQLMFNLRNSYDNYTTQKENVEVAKRVYESNYNKFKQGLISSLDLTQSNSNYLQAQNNYVNSVHQLLQSKLELDKLYNNL